MEKINIAELLKDCPKGMELDYALFEDTIFIGVEEDKNYPILIKLKDGSQKRLTKYGGHSNAGYAKCVIFPKGKTTWEGFVPPLPSYQIKNGDVIVDKYGAVAIYKRIHSSYEGSYVDFHCGITSKSRSLFIKDSDSLQHCGEIDSIRLASEEEKQELFQAIKDNGYKWNAETKTFEKLIKPIFKKGDKVRVKKGFPEPRIARIIEDVCDTFYTLVSVGKIDFTDQNNWELVPNKFDIATLKPFDKVLCRHNKDNKWKATLFSHLDEDFHSHCYKFVTVSGSYPYMIPYEGNHHLLGTTNDCDDFYKTWEE